MYIRFRLLELNYRLSLTSAFYSGILLLSIPAAHVLRMMTMIAVHKRFHPTSSWCHIHHTVKISVKNTTVFTLITQHNAIVIITVLLALGCSLSWHVGQHVRPNLLIFSKCGRFREFFIPYPVTLDILASFVECDHTRSECDHTKKTISCDHTRLNDDVSLTYADIEPRRNLLEPYKSSVPLQHGFVLHRIQRRNST
jgi:hypothetical protein